MAEVFSVPDTGRTQKSNLPGHIDSKMWTFQETEDIPYGVTDQQKWPVLLDFHR